MAIKKVISSRGPVVKKVVTPVKVEAAPVVEPIVEETSSTRSEGRDNYPATKKACPFCTKKTIPTYTDLATLKHFLTDRAKIYPRGRSGVCSKHQRAVAKNIKYARHLGLLPFVPQV